MKIMLDCSPKKIAEYDEKYSHDFWQLRTPLTQYALSGKPYGLDNGCFAQFKKAEWLKLIADAEKHKPKFVTLPDIVGDARRTLELFEHFKPITAGLPRALVLQDGIGECSIPWNDIAAVFIGGTDKFKCSQECANAVKTAKMMGNIWVHVGRVNTTSRARGWMGIGDSLDGSGISRFDDRLHEVLSVIQANEKQERLF